MTIPSWIPRERGRRLPLPDLRADLPLVRGGSLHDLQTALWLPNHRHAWWELHYLHRGRLEVELPGGGSGPDWRSTIVAHGGWFTLTRPRRIHRARDGIMAPCQLVWLQLDPAGSWRGTPFAAADRRLITAAWRARGDSTWPAPEGTDALYRRLRDLLGSPGAGLDPAALRLALCELILRSAQPATGAQRPPELARALAALTADPARPCTVAAAAARAGLSPGRLHDLCARHLGVTPAAWQLAQRLAAARGPLAAGTAVKIVARDLGFSSPRYFAYAFRREVGVPPSLYAAASAEAARGASLAW